MIKRTQIDEKFKKVLFRKIDYYEQKQLTDEPNE